MFKWITHRKQRNNQEILAVLKELVSLLKQSDESAYSGLDIGQIISRIEQQSSNLRAGEKVDYEALKALFYPTGPIQEISIDNGWGDLFIQLAARFDSATLFRG